MLYSQTQNVLNKSLARGSNPPLAVYYTEGNVGGDWRSIQKFRPRVALYCTYGLIWCVITNNHSYLVNFTFFPAKSQRSETPRININ